MIKNILISAMFFVALGAWSNMHDFLEANDLGGLKTALDAGGDISEENTRGLSLVRRAAQAGRLEIFEELIARGAVTDLAMNSMDLMVLYRDAEANGREAIVTYLRNSGLIAERGHRRSHASDFETIQRELAELLREGEHVGAGFAGAPTPETELSDDEESEIGAEPAVPYHPLATLVLGDDDDDDDTGGGADEDILEELRETNVLTTTVAVENPSEQRPPTRRPPPLSFPLRVRVGSPAVPLAPRGERRVNSRLRVAGAGVLRSSQWVRRARLTPTEFGRTVRIEGGEVFTKGRLP